MAEIKGDNSGNAPLASEMQNGLKILTELKNTAFDRALMLVAAAAFCLLLLFVITQVLIRYVTVHIGFSLPWTEESARYLLIFITFIGSAIACRRQEHITITSLVERFPARIRLVFEFISCLLIIFFLAVATGGCYKFTVKMINVPVGAIPWLKTGHLYGIITFGLALTALYQLRWFIHYVSVIRRLFWGKGVGSHD